ncbi:MAG: hypothetical protein ACTSWQ_06635 [Candidatus Thorarchaeota archaeon]
MELRSIYSNKDYREEGEPFLFLYDTMGCGCCSDHMKTLTMEKLEDHIEALKKRLDYARKVKTQMILMEQMGNKYMEE